MHTDILSPKELFQKDVQYTIPPFQRPYVWNQDDQWEPLWEDVRSVAETYLEELERSGHDEIEAEQRTSPHFLGAVVLKQVPTAARDIDQREVIDGQQRVTTLQLLLDAIQQVCEDAEQRFLKIASRRLSRLVTNDELVVGNEDHHVFKLWPTRSDREAFRHAMDNGLPVDDFEESLIVQAHEFFKLQVEKWMEDGSASMEDKIGALEAAASTMLQMVVIDLSPKDDPSLIFETLNARGTPLEQSDLIRNFVVSQSEGREGDTWGSLDDRWWREEARQGRLLRPRLDMVLNYWLAMRIGSEISPSRVFDAFRGYVSEKDLNFVMCAVKDDLASYREYETKKGRNADEKLFYYRTDIMQARVITPVLLLLLGIEPMTAIRTLDVLESFLIRRMICRQTTKDYNRMVQELTGRIQENGLERADEVAAGFLTEQTAYSREWPTDESVAHALETAPLYRLLTRGRLRLVLEGIEAWLRAKAMSEQPDAPRYLTIEHLMPVGWRKESWPLPQDGDEEVAIYHRNTLVHTIGNLTLVTQKLNSSLSNSPWVQKRGGLQEHSVLLLNSELMSESEWNEDTIRFRSRRMADIVCEVWPGPEKVK